MQAVRSRFANDFELVRWVTYVFIGGAINASIVQIFGDYLLRTQQIFGGPLVTPTQQAIFLYLPLALFILSPLLLSIVLTRAKPEKQLVPPLYIQLISVAWFSGFILIRYPTDLFPGLVLYFLYAYFVGVLQNRVARYLLGIAVNPEDFVWYSFTVGETPAKLKGILETEKFRNNLGLTTVEQDEDRPRMIVKGGGPYSYILEISQIIGTSLTTMTMIFYDLADWYVRPVSENLKEFATATSDYLKGIFRRPEFNLNVGDIGWGSTVQTSELVSDTIREMEGVIPRFREISRLGWLKITAFVGAVVFIAVSAIYLQDYQTSIGLMVALLLYVVFELRSSTAGAKE